MLQKVQRHEIGYSALPAFYPIGKLHVLAKVQRWDSAAVETSIRAKGMELITKLRTIAPLSGTASPCVARPEIGDRLPSPIR